MWQMIGLLGELERSLISERIRAGVKAAWHRGVKFGRKRKLTPQQIEHARELIDKGDARHKVADLFNVNRTTLYRRLPSELGKYKQAGQSIWTLLGLHSILASSKTVSSVETTVDILAARPAIILASAPSIMK
jgi:DNA invertase Pin-like site-specific DNA recombinase